MPEAGESTRHAKQDEAWARIRDAIQSGYLRPGERLTEQDLALRLGMSRTPVRESLHRLAQEGLVRRSSVAGWQVLSLSPEQAAQLYEVRAVLEGMAARAAAAERSEEDLRELEELVRQSEQAIVEADLPELQRHHQAFHLRVAAAARNQFLHELLANLAVRSGLTMSIGLRRAERRTETVAEHRRLVAAIAAGDAAAAEEAARSHMSSARQSVVAELVATAADDPLRLFPQRRD